MAYFLKFSIDKASDVQLTELSDELGLCLSLQEMKAIQTYFNQLKRNPTDVELQTIAQTWSEHCYHKTFKGEVVTPKGRILVKSLLSSYIARPVKELKPAWCLDTFRDNAGIVSFERRKGVSYAIAVKVETHNHPSAVEPFGGAATGTGGVIRDVLGVWADPIACTDVLGFGPLECDSRKLPVGIKHPNMFTMALSPASAAMETHGHPNC
jgi:phosphoribosylformylglycinamidine synthase